MSISDSKAIAGGRATPEIRVSYQIGEPVLAVPSSRPPGADDHALRVARMSRAMAQVAGLPVRFVEQVTAAGKTHDIGKRFLPQSLLGKADGLLVSEWALLRKHAEFGAYLLGQQASELQIDLGVSIHAALLHHERWDGSGYPYGLKGLAIPLEARIVAVADVYDALLTPRPYKDAWTHQAAVAYLMSRRDVDFDPVCVEAFEGALKELPEDWRHAALDSDGAIPNASTAVLAYFQSFEASASTTPELI